MITLEVEKQIQELGYDPEWSLCKIDFEGETRYLFRLINITSIAESSGKTITEAVERYLLDLNNKKKENGK